MMDSQHNTSTTQSLKDSFLSDTTAYHSKPIRPPRSQASRSQKTVPEPTPLSPEALSKLKPKDEDQATLYTHARIVHFLRGLPDVPTDPTGGIIPTPDFKDSKSQVHYYTPPFQPHHMHIFNRFQEMQRTEPHAEFHLHKARLSLEYSEDEKVGMHVGVEDEEHGYRIHKHMRWLRDKWLGYEVDLLYYVMEYEDDGKEPDRGQDMET